MSDDRALNVDLQGTGAPAADGVCSLERVLADASSNTCVICLDNISEKAITLPCEHTNFDFTCLGTWLQRQPTCPLCKVAVCGIKFDLDAPSGPQTFCLPLPHPKPVSSSRAPSRIDSQEGHNRARQRARHSREQRAREQGDGGVARRREVYRNRTYSLHVGSNLISRYRTLTSQSFVRDSTLLHRARIWIRRELQVFSFLDSDAPPQQSPAFNIKRRARNAQFLVEYILAMLKSIDIKGSTGQAQELLQEFLGRENARLFLHELENWLRSPYRTLGDWDRAVQYEHLQAGIGYSKLCLRSMSAT